ncbi:MAG: hypothetical protein KGO52_09850 [Nitrospirota bacterium]|nr:hypothetical protein [Nitrospirota bacterium]MDE3034535.1 hypothetical protein [Nitrospirota bacterium]MDE3117736.1 hypothetical protein [Nitrospirota bacterium]MDE3225577.1 hypothetical protein [Nitrospirota bacterium]MDE3243008.1 hypothetical protein [Nitrospirota bacterium]
MKVPIARIVAALVLVVAAAGKYRCARSACSLPAIAVLGGSLFGFGMWRFRTQFE